MDHDWWRVRESPSQRETLTERKRPLQREESERARRRERRERGSLIEKPLIDRRERESPPQR